MNTEAKIRALLRKAERTDNPHEAEAFSAKAEELMLKLGIEDLGEDQDEHKTTRQMTRRDYVYHGRDAVTFAKFFGHAVAQGLAGQMVRTIRDMEGRRSATIVFLGDERDLSRIALLHDSLLVQLNHAMDLWMDELKQTFWWDASTSTARDRAREQYIRTYSLVVFNRLQEAREQAENAANVGSAIARRTEDVEAFTAKIYPNLTRTPIEKLNGGDIARWAATRDAKNANLGSTIDAANKKELSHG